MAKRAILVRLDDDILTEVDAARGPMSRQVWIIRAMISAARRPKADPTPGARPVDKPAIAKPAAPTTRPTIDAPIAAHPCVPGKRPRPADDVVAAMPSYLRERLEPTWEPRL